MRIHLDILQEGDIAKAIYQIRHWFNTNSDYDIFCFCETMRSSRSLYVWHFWDYWSRSISISSYASKWNDNNCQPNQTDHLNFFRKKLCMYHVFLRELTMTRTNSTYFTRVSTIFRSVRERYKQMIYARNRCCSRALQVTLLELDIKGFGHSAFVANTYASAHNIYRQRQWTNSKAE